MESLPVTSELQVSDDGEPKLVAIDLTDEERKLMVLDLNQYGGLARHAYQLLCPVLGQSNVSGMSVKQRRVMTVPGR